MEWGAQEGVFAQRESVTLTRKPPVTTNWQRRRAATLSCTRWMEHRESCTGSDGEPKTCPPHNQRLYAESGPNWTQIK